MHNWIVRIQMVWTVWAGSVVLCLLQEWDLIDWGSIQNGLPYCMSIPVDLTINILIGVLSWLSDFIPWQGKGTLEDRRAVLLTMSQTCMVYTHFVNSHFVNSHFVNSRRYHTHCIHYVSREKGGFYTSCCNERRIGEIYTLKGVHCKHSASGEEKGEHSTHYVYVPACWVIGTIMWLCMKLYNV